jgi:hypothetical protein
MTTCLVTLIMRNDGHSNLNEVITGLTRHLTNVLLEGIYRECKCKAALVNSLCIFTVQTQLIISSLLLTIHSKFFHHFLLTICLRPNISMDNENKMDCCSKETHVLCPGAGCSKLD